MDSRNDPRLAQDLLTHLPPAARQMLHAAIDAAYRDAGKHFDPDAGADMQLFGFTIFKFVAHQIRKAVDADPTLGITVIGSSTGAFRLQVGPFVVAPYACGYRTTDDPWEQFPSNDKGAGLLAETNSGQIEIFPQFDESPTAIVIGHYGHPDSGLAAIYLKKPTAQTNGRISRWGYVEPVYQMGSGTSAAPEAPRSPVLPGPAKVVRPTVLPFKRKPAQDTETERA